MIEKLEESLTYIRQKCTLQPEYAIILGSGLKNLVHEVEVVAEIPFADIPHFPQATVEGHGGSLVIGNVSGKNVVVMSGRFHYYEGYDMQQVTYPVRVFKKWGIEKLIVSNASGGVNEQMEVGDVMLISDHINLQSEHPLRGKNDDRLGPRFPDMLEAYDKAWLKLGSEICAEHKIRYSTGVYVGVTGPTFETPAEYRFFNRIGGDAVGMSTVPEVIVARHMHMRVFAISVISDIGYPLHKSGNVSHSIVLQKAAEAEPKLTLVVKELLKRDT